MRRRFTECELNCIPADVWEQFCDTFQSFGLCSPRMEVYEFMSNLDYRGSYFHWRFNRNVFETNFDVVQKRIRSFFLDGNSIVRHVSVMGFVDPRTSVAIAKNYIRPSTICVRPSLIESDTVPSDTDGVSLRVDGTCSELKPSSNRLSRYAPDKRLPPIRSVSSSLPSL